MDEPRCPLLHPELYSESKTSSHNYSGTSARHLDSYPLFEGEKFMREWDIQTCPYYRGSVVLSIKCRAATQPGECKIICLNFVMKTRDCVYA